MYVVINPTHRLWTSQINETIALNNFFLEQKWTLLANIDYYDFEHL